MSHAKPSRLRLIQGKDSRRKINKEEPKPDAKVKVPRAPSHMTPNAKKFWRKIARELHKPGLLTNVDVTALEMLCESYATWRDAVDKIDEFGVLVKTPNGYPVQGPYLQIANKAQQQMLRLLAEFGLTPASRTRIRGEAKVK